MDTSQVSSTMQTAARKPFMPFLRLPFLIALPIVVLSTSSPQAMSNPNPGDVFRDCETCPELVVVPSGIFIMGLKGTRKTSKPAHRVNMAKSFAIGRYEITFQQWQACRDGGGCKHSPDDHNWGKSNRPVINITWHQAKNYTRWLSKLTGNTYRLPTESEWEYAARGGTTTIFWWGNKVGSSNANCRDCVSRECCSAKVRSCCSHGTLPVGSFKPNPYGLHDTAANVFEWVEDCWVKDYRGAPDDGSAAKAQSCRSRVIRGGSFYYFNKVARSAYRAKNPPAVKSYWLGFRVVRELP